MNKRLENVVGEENMQSNITGEENTINVSSFTKEVFENYEEFDKIFPIVDIEGVSLKDSFMQYEPENDIEKRIIKSIVIAKKIGLQNFRIPSMDPSYGDDNKTIVYQPGRRPVVDKSAYWWYKNAHEIMPSKNSRLRDDLEHDIVLGVMQIKFLVEEAGYSVKQAWKAVCVDSIDLGNYWNTKNGGHGLEPTGSRQIGKCCDLGNTFKILQKHKSKEFMYAGGLYCCDSFTDPIGAYGHIRDPYDVYYGHTGLIVMNV